MEAAKAFFPKGINLARESAEQFYGVGQEAMGQTLKTSEAIGALVRLIEDDTISTKIARVVFDHMRAGEGDPAMIVEARGLRQITDPAALHALIDAAFMAHAPKVAQYREGQEKLFGFFVGQLMKASGGQASPTHLNALLKQRLDAPEEP